ncbi:hypothetical protein NQ318_002006 [Aromia moschata]|uniref:Uncharacterized protein n=1 Tax=Aromia moschata TaxID=1265417 RepID=A0AAV8Z4C2_9CUCU|nr:hypothetical protein NQ318_002006 [Aromia moschata]
MDKVERIDPSTCGGVTTSGGNQNGSGRNIGGGHLMVSGAAVDDGSSDDANTPLQSPQVAEHQPRRG